jgi:hypothetical protein
VSRYPFQSDLFLAADVAVLDDEQDRIDFAVTGKPFIGAAVPAERVPVADGRAAARLLDVLLD